MSDADDEASRLGARIDELEMKVAYQDDAIETLNATITAQWTQIDVLTRKVAELRDRLQDAEAAVTPAAANEKPPHY